METGWKWLRTSTQCTKRWLWSCILTKVEIQKSFKSYKRWRILRFESIVGSLIGVACWGFSDSPWYLCSYWIPVARRRSSHTQLSCVKHRCQERLTDIEKEEGEGDGKKENEEDPEEEDHSCVVPYFLGGFLCDLCINPIMCTLLKWDADTLAKWVAGKWFVWNGSLLTSGMITEFLSNGYECGTQTCGLDVTNGIMFLFMVQTVTFHQLEMYINVPKCARQVTRSLMKHDVFEEGQSSRFQCAWILHWIYDGFRVRSLEKQEAKKQKEKEEEEEKNRNSVFGVFWVSGNLLEKSFWSSGKKCWSDLSGNGRAGKHHITNRFVKMFKEVLIYSSTGFKLVDASLRITANSKFQVDFLEIADVVNTVQRNYDCKRYPFCLHHYPWGSGCIQRISMFATLSPRFTAQRTCEETPYGCAWQYGALVGEGQKISRWNRRREGLASWMNYQNVDDELDVWIFGDLGVVKCWRWFFPIWRKGKLKGKVKR